MRNGSYRIADDGFWKKINKDFGTTGGVYELYCMMPKHRIVPVQRLLKTDVEGTLYIGKAASFLDRVIELKKSISPKYVSSGHECGFRYKESKAIQERFPYEHLYMELHGTTDERVLELDMLNSYLKEFGELPPLNRMG